LYFHWFLKVFLIPKEKSSPLFGKVVRIERFGWSGGPKAWGITDLGIGYY
jgi:hypothetical protein